MANKSFFKIANRGLPRLKAGFTLIETLLAVLILATAIAGPLSIAAKGLSLSLIAKDQMIGVYLAQDGLEYVRFIRDTNRLRGQSDWLAGFDGTSNGHTTDLSGGQANCTGGNACTLDSLQDKVTFCGTGTVCASSPLYYDTTNKYYTYNTAGTTKTIFTRTLSISIPSSNPNEADVTVIVQWKDVGGVTRSVQLRDNILNWE
jgi:prepilin-type N-terminal cleavage/methylation domain-containing protein